ncbi:MAG TPA: hypothetical protein VM238_18390 [Phycisphaerae bacterium]|nr:hypothetical protein [Phycisphaerae bacterium]
MNAHAFRREVKRLDPRMDVMLCLQTGGIEILRLDRDPPMRVWSSFYAGAKGWQWEAPGKHAIEGIRRAIWVEHRLIDAEDEVERLKHQRATDAEMADADDQTMDAVAWASKRYSRPFFKRRKKDGTV